MPQSVIHSSVRILLLYNNIFLSEELMWYFRWWTLCSGYFLSFFNFENHRIYDAYHTKSLDNPLCFNEFLFKGRNILWSRWIGESGSNATKAVSIKQETSEHDHCSNQLTFHIVGVDITVTRWRHGSCCPVETRDVVTKASYSVGISGVLGPAPLCTSTMIRSKR